MFYFKQIYFLKKYFNMPQVKLKEKRQSAPDTILFSHLSF